MQFHWEKQVTEPTTLVDFIASDGVISKSAAKKALAFGGAWLKVKGTKKQKRVRRATLALNFGDAVAFYYDEKLLKTAPPCTIALQQTSQWGLWYKPANVPAQGTPYGDVGCMEHQVKHLSQKTNVFLIHRLDKEAAGIMLFAYTKQAAAALSQQWQTEQVQKVYQANILGTVQPLNGEITLPLDGKSAHTLYQVISTNASESHPCSQVEVEIKTGRYHQIRKHFDAIGHPLLGDPKYGQGNNNKTGLKLVATRLRFICPSSQQAVECVLPEDLRLPILK